jgi:hypothetical protein
MNPLSNLASRGLFVVAFGLAGLAVWEKLANLFGRTLVFLGGYVAPSRLLELAVIALLFVIALQLREIKHVTEGRTGGH